jgi:predicted nucleic acid-binding protein
LIDTNVLISALKNPGGETLKLLARLIEDQSITLVGNDLLVEEYLRYARAFKSVTVFWIVSALLDRMELVTVGEGHIRACKPYIKTLDRVDILHAATCLKSGSVLITNDRHFDRIRGTGIIDVWGISRALEEIEG